MKKQGDLDMAKEVVEICEKSGLTIQDALKMVKDKYGMTK